MQLPHAQPPLLGCLFWSAKRFVLGIETPQLNWRAKARVSERALHCEVVLGWEFSVLLAPRIDGMRWFPRDQGDAVPTAERSNDIVVGPEWLEQGRDHCALYFSQNSRLVKSYENEFSHHHAPPRITAHHLGKIFFARLDLSTSMMPIVRPSI
jgi:hypothetical protein